MTECVITSSVLISALLILRFLFRGKISRRLQYALWGLVLVRLLLPFSLFGSPISVMNAVPGGGSLGERQVYVLPVSKEPVSEASGVAVSGGQIVGDANSFGYPVLSGDGGTVTRYAEKMSVEEILKIVWLSGGIAFALWFALANLLFYRRLRRTRRAYPAGDCRLKLYVAEGIASPCLFGLFPPAVYLTPKAAEGEESVCHVLAHELCHYRHGDHVWSVLRGVCLALWWWNPLVWAAAYFSRQDSELACDEAVIQKLGEGNRLAYGRTLVDMIAVRKAPSGLLNAATTMVSGKRGIGERLNMIVKNPKTVLPAAAAILLAAAVCAGCTFTGAQSAEGKPDAGKDSPDYARQLYDSRNPYVGDASADGALLSALNVSGELGNYTMELDTKAEPYVLRIGFTDKVTEAVKLNHTMRKNAVVLLALIDNLSEVQWYYSYLDQEFGGGGSFLGSLTAEEAAEAYGVTSVKDYAASVESFRTLLESLDAQDASPEKYTLIKLKNGEVQSGQTLLWGDDIELAEDVIMNSMVKSAAWPGTDPKTLGECYLLRAAYSDGTTSDYYAYQLSGRAVMQRGEKGSYSYIDDTLYGRLSDLGKNRRSSTDRGILDQCVSDAILSANKGEFPLGGYAVEAHTNLKTVEDADTVTVYAMALYLEFDLSGGGCAETGGSHMPVAVTFTKNSAGEYELKEYWTPRDGTYYAASIKERFPSDIYEDAMDTQKYVTAQIQACYEQAIRYGRVDTDKFAAGLLEAVVSSPAEASDPNAYIKAHEGEYRKLIYCGKYTLRYCFARFEKGGETGLAGAVMASACREILGTEDIAAQTATGQEWYNAFKEHVLNLRDQVGSGVMEKAYPNSSVLLQELEK